MHLLRLLSKRGKDIFAQTATLHCQEDTAQTLGLPNNSRLYTRQSVVILDVPFGQLGFVRDLHRFTSSPHPHLIGQDNADCLDSRLEVLALVRYGINDADGNCHLHTRTHI